MKDKILKFIKSPWGIVTIFIIVAGLLIWGGVSLFNAGAKSTLNAKLDDVQRQLENTSAQRNPNGHLQLLARKKALEQLISQY